MATGTIPNNLAADVNALNSKKVDFMRVSSTDGYNSAATKTAIRNAVDALPNGAAQFGTLSAGDQGIILALKAGSNISVVFYLRYGSSRSSKGLIASMTKYDGTWGDWVAISP